MPLPCFFFFGTCFIIYSCERLAVPLHGNISNCFYNASIQCNRGGGLFSSFIYYTVIITVIGHHFIFTSCTPYSKFNDTSPAVGLTRIKPTRRVVSLYYLKRRKLLYRFAGRLQCSNNITSVLAVVGWGWQIL